QVISLNSGSVTAPVVSDGDTIRAVEQVDIEGVTSDAALASRELPGILENVSLLAAQLRTAEGTLGALGLETGNAHLSKLGETAQRLFDQFTQPRGSLQTAMARTAAARAQVSQSLAGVDSIRRLLASDAHS